MSKFEQQVSDAGEPVVYSGGATYKIEVVKLIELITEIDFETPPFEVTVVREGEGVPSHVQIQF